jgi:hypothetical protein
MNIQTKNNSSGIPVKVWIPPGLPRKTVTACFSKRKLKHTHIREYISDILQLLNPDK